MNSFPTFLFFMKSPFTEIPMLAQVICLWTKNVYGLLFFSAIFSQILSIQIVIF